LKEVRILGKKEFTQIKNRQESKGPSYSRLVSLFL